MAKWAEHRHWTDKTAEEINKSKEVDVILYRIRRVANLIKSDAIHKSRPTVREKASEIEALLVMLEKKLNE